MLKMFMTTAALICSAAHASEQSDNSVQFAEYAATIVRVIDGDTLEVVVDLWPGLTGTYSIRVRGIDAPETRRGSCPEREEEMLEWGAEAKAQVEKLYPAGTPIKLEDIEPDPFAGRFVADVRRRRTDRWLFLKNELLDRGLAVEWTPDMSDVPWCLVLDTR
ncbi:thermonuclease family protein [Roseobacter denitrificans]|nr:thermonuclease family protein [Roseobacter denitrificans]